MRSKYWLLLILVVAGVLRFWKLGEVPASPDWDEAALGYNAYSILKTGRDEYGVKFPLIIRSFDDYKPPLYVYLTIPSVFAFGLNIRAVRLPSAIMGVLAVAGVYLLTREILRTQSLELRTQQGKYVDMIAHVSAGLMAISPWHIQFSRIAFEANAGVTLNIWGTYWFIRGLRNPKLLILSAIVFGMALYAYHSERIFVPSLVMLLGLIFWREVRSLGRRIVPGLIAGIIVVLPLTSVLSDARTLTRLQGTSTLSDQTRLLSESVVRLQLAREKGDILGQIVNNRRLVYTKTVLSGYLAHFSSKWLLVSGDNPRHHAPDVGLVYIWEIPFLIWGMREIFKNRGRIRVLIFGWLLLSPIAASPTSGLPHAIRTLVFLPVWQWFSAVGLVRFIGWIKDKRWHVKTGGVIYGVGAGIIFSQYLSLYFLHLNRETAFDWQYGYKQAVEYAKEHYDEYDKIVVSTKLEQPHMFFLFYLKYPPEKYLAGGGTKSGGFAEAGNRFDKFEFRPISWDTEKKGPRILFIGKPDEILDEAEEVIYYPNGEKAMEIKHG